MIKSDDDYMRLALIEAQKAYDLFEVPVGAIIVDENGEVLAKGYNQTITSHDPTAHAEVVALRQLGQLVSNYRFPKYTMYVTLEPCCMCAMALIHARLQRIVFGASDLKTGACGSAFSLITDEKHNHRIEVTRGVLENECSTLISSFLRCAVNKSEHKKNFKKNSKKTKINPHYSKSYC